MIAWETMKTDRLDWILRGGTVADGLGGEPARADVGVAGDRIAAVGDLSQAAAANEFDATGLLVCPGFIDVHTHSDAYLLVEPGAPSKIRQGVTTEITGNCGASAAPRWPRWFTSGRKRPMTTSKPAKVWPMRP